MPAASKKSKKSIAGGKTKPKGATKKKTKEETWKSYLRNVLKQVHPELAITKGAMDVLNSCMTDLFEQISKEAGKQLDISGKMTLTEREIQTACRLLLPGELAKHAASEGTKAVAKERSSKA